LLNLKINLLNVFTSSSASKNPENNSKLKNMAQFYAAMVLTIHL